MERRSAQGPIRRLPPRRPPASPLSSPSQDDFGEVTGYEEWEREYIPPPRRPRRRRGCGCTPLAVAGVLSLAILILGLSGLLILYASDRILSGVHILDQDIGAMSASSAADVISREWNSRPITVDAGAMRWQVYPESAGLTLDVEATLASAYARGRAREHLGDLFFWGERIDISPIWYFDPARAESLLRAAAEQYDIAPRDAAVQLSTGGVTATPAEAGRQVDLSASLAWFGSHAGQVYAEGYLPLRTRELAPEITDVSSVVDLAGRWLTAALTLRLYDPIRDESLAWSVPPAEREEWIRLFRRPEDPAILGCGIDPESVAGYLRSRMAELGEERYLDVETTAPALAQALADGRAEISTRIYHHPGQHTVAAGETLSSIAEAYGFPYPWLLVANPGLGDSLWVGQKVTIPSPDELLPLPPVQGKRIQVSLSEQRVRVFEAGTLKWDWPASTGIDSSPTSPGIFQVQSHQEEAYASLWDLWMPWFVGIYRPAPGVDFMNGFHGFPRRGDRQLLWTGDLGRRVTYGCILLSTENAQLLFGWAQAGVVVEIIP